MMSNQLESSKSITAEIHVTGSSNTVFKNFIDNFSAWWPAAYTWSGSTNLKKITLGLKVGEWAVEKSHNGFIVTWAQTLSITPGEKFILAWHIGPNRDPQPNSQQASMVDIEFSQITQNSVTVSLTHHHLEHNGQGYELYRESLANEDYGWPFLLKQFKKFNDAE